MSTTTQGAYLNQVFIGLFRPDADGKPRWVGNLKQYQLGLVNGALDLVDAKGKPAVLGDSGFFTPLAESFWSTDSVFFTNMPSGTPLSVSDLPDGGIVEKGGAAQRLRENNLHGATSRNVYTLEGSSLAPFSNATASVSSAFTDEEIAWVRGEANIPLDLDHLGRESFIGSYKDGTTVKNLAPTGARHSIHGDVVHSRPMVVNYGNGDVAVYYGSNDGLFHAVNGNKTGTGAGHELWSFIAPEHYGTIKRLRAGTPSLLLPETDSTGATRSASDGSMPKDYGMDGPIGIYTRYTSSGSTLSEAFIYPTMRRGGRSVYAFDVSAKDTPTLMWKITGGAGGDYDKLAQTWSTPKAIPLPAKAGVHPALLFMGGGYDPAEDTNNSSDIGNVVYVINGRTGSRIAAFPTDYSVPSDVTVIDSSGDGVPDRAYVADVRGNLYRIDIPDGDLLASDTWASVQAVKIASLGGKVFYAPDVVVTNKFVAVLLGTGDREKPLMVSTSDNFFVVKDNVGAPRGSVLSKADFTRVARIDNVSMQPTGRGESGHRS